MFSQHRIYTACYFIDLPSLFTLDITSCFPFILAFSVHNFDISLVLFSDKSQKGHASLFTYILQQRYNAHTSISKEVTSKPDHANPMANCLLRIRIC